MDTRVRRRRPRAGIKRRPFGGRSVKWNAATWREYPSFSWRNRLHESTSLRMACPTSIEDGLDLRYHLAARRPLAHRGAAPHFRPRLASASRLVGVRGRFLVLP
jgi:hypothetical protein